MISFLTPTRKRPEMMTQFVSSVLDTADRPADIEFVVYIENDDSSYFNWPHSPQVKMKWGPWKNLAQCYEWERASGDIFVLGADDVIFRTQGWDTKVMAEFAKYPDKIVLVHGDDGDPNTEKTNATMPFIHRQWVNVIGRYLPPYFTGDFTDTWLSDIANALGRRAKIDIITEHIHPAFGKREQDETDKIKWEKHFRENMPQKYIDTLPEREIEIAKLKKWIEGFKS